MRWFMEHDLRGLLQYGALVFWSLFCVVNPLGAAATFAASTTTLPDQERRRAITKVMLGSTLVLAAALAVGNIFVFRVGIYTAGLRVSGGILLLSGVVAEWLRGPEAFAPRPLAGPPDFSLVAGLGALATTVLYTGEHDEHWRRGVTAACVAGVLVSSWIALRAAGRIAARLGPTGVRYLSGVFKLTVAGWSVDFIATGVRDFLPLILHTAPAR
jgi:multiple antibiotic resistance protein